MATLGDTHDQAGDKGRGYEEAKQNNRVRVLAQCEDPRDSMRGEGWYEGNGGT